MTSRPKPTASSRHHGHSSSQHRRSRDREAYDYTTEPKMESTIPPHSAKSHRLPFHREQGQVTPGIKAEGESYRRGIHPLKFLKICFRSTSRLSMIVNVLWPVVPAAIALFWAMPEQHLWIFLLNYIAMIPAANLLGFAGQELARKLPKVLGVIIEVTFGSVVEIILFMILISRNGEANVPIIKAAILGSILANLLLCLGVCFIAGGFSRHEQQFHEAVSEVGSGLMLVAGMALIIPSAFSTALNTGTGAETEGSAKQYEYEVLRISRATAIILIVAYLVYVYFQMHSHHGLYDDILEQDELKDKDRKKDLAKEKLTLTECVLAIGIAIACVSLIAYILVQQIHWIVEKRHIKDAFLGLILVPLVEKAAEHLTAVDEAYDDQMNFALSHVLGASVQTALLNTPLVVLVGWGLNVPMELNFEPFMAVVLILAVLVVGNFLRDGKSNYLEGCLCVFVYIIIAISAFYYPNPHTGGVEGSSSSSGEGGH